MDHLRRTNCSGPLGKRAAGVCCIFFILLALAGCATKPGNPAGVPGSKRDPLQPVNRQIYRFNHLFYSAVLRPVATGYVKVTPTPVRTGISNFFDNLAMPITIINDLLQLKPLHAVRDTGRFFTNSTVGLLGFLDPASQWGLDPHSEDFGITLARWGMPSGPYIQIPLLGPSDVRDAFGLYVDHFGSSFYWTGWKPATRNVIYAVGIVQAYSNFLDLDKLLDKAYDPYALMRDGYLQNRDQTIRKNLPNYNPNALPNYGLPDESGGG